jgi:hypothetical protein
MKLGEFIKEFSHNNLIRLVYKCEGGHESVTKSWQDISMDWQIINHQGIFRHYINNEVLGIASICIRGNFPETINIVIEKLENQPFIAEYIENNQKYSDNN